MSDASSPFFSEESLEILYDSAFKPNMGVLGINRLLSLLNEIRYRFYKKTQTYVYLPYFVSTVIVVSILLNLVSMDGVKK